MLLVSLYLKANTQKLVTQNSVKIGPVDSEKSQVVFSYVNDLGPQSENNLDLEYSQTFIYLIRCLYLPTFKSQAAIVSENTNVFTFSYRKP